MGINKHGVTKMYSLIENVLFFTTFWAQIQIFLTFKFFFSTETRLKIVFIFLLSWSECLKVSHQRYCWWLQADMNDTTKTISKVKKITALWPSEWGDCLFGLGGKRHGTMAILFPSEPPANSAGQEGK